MEELGEVLADRDLCVVFAVKRRPTAALGMWELAGIIHEMEGYLIWITQLLVVPVSIGVVVGY